MYLLYKRRKNDGRVKKIIIIPLCSREKENLIFDTFCKYTLAIYYYLRAVIKLIHMPPGVNSTILRIYVTPEKHLL